MNHSYKLNYSFQQQDDRDYIFSHLFFLINSNDETPTHTPPSFTLNNKITQILDQEELGACVSNATAQYILMATNNNLHISRLFHYYCGRLLSRYSNDKEDTGLNIRSACEIIRKVGVCLEKIWEYDISKFNIMPPLQSFQYSNCNYFNDYTYYSIKQTKTASLLDNIKYFLTQNNLPILFGIMIYSSFMTHEVKKTGVIPIPNEDIETLDGGHSMLIVGYNDTTKMFSCVNSWGSSWGSGGYCFIPYDYITNPNLANDFFGFNFTYLHID